MALTSGISSRNSLSLARWGCMCHITTYLLFFPENACGKNWLNGRSWYFVRQIVARRHRIYNSGPSYSVF